MSRYAISAVRLNADDTKIMQVMWAPLGDTLPMEYDPSLAPVSEVVDALIAGNYVELIIQKDTGEWIHTDAEFKPVTYEAGVEGITNNKYALADLPTF